MMVWIDGVYGVGKTSVAEKLKKVFPEHKTVIMDSDYYYQKMIINNPRSALGGILPQNNMNFIRMFRKEIEEQIKRESEMLIVTMSLTQRECKEGIFDYFADTGIEIVHIILTAHESVIRDRIEKDVNRDKDFAVEYLEENMKFLEKNFADATWIDTNSKSAEDIVNEISFHLKNCND